MKQEEKIMFEYFKSIVEDYGVDLTQRIIKILPDDVVRQLSPDQHNQLTTNMQDEVIKIIQSVLAIFDNVGFVSPPEMDDEPLELLNPEEEEEIKEDYDITLKGEDITEEIDPLEDNFEKSWINYATQQFQFIPSVKKKKE